MATSWDSDAWPAEALAPALLELVGQLSDVMFCAKDRDGRYTAVNDAFVRRTSETSRREVLGRTAAELFVAPLAERYEEQDQHVMTTGQPLRRELELIRREGGSPGWFLTAKLPVFGPGSGGSGSGASGSGGSDAGGSGRGGAGGPGGDGREVLGLVSISEDLREADDSDPDVLAVARVLEVVREEVGRPLRPADLADVAGCSLAALERRTRRILGLSPTQLVLRARIDRASQLLTGTAMPLADVGAACGFYDQPTFTRQFARLSGETPGQFRRRGATGRVAPST